MSRRFPLSWQHCGLPCAMPTAGLCHVGWEQAGGLGRCVPGGLARLPRPRSHLSICKNVLKDDTPSLTLAGLRTQ